MKNNYASFLQRLAAAFIDGLIFSGFGMFVQIGHGGLAIHWLLIGFYHVFMYVNYGATVGKMIMKLKVVREDGKKLTYNDAILREFASYLSGVVFILGYLNVLWNPKKQAWHDKIAKTYVIMAK